MKKLYNLFCENCGIRFQSENPSKRTHSPSCASLLVARLRMEKRDRKQEEGEKPLVRIFGKDVPIGGTEEEQ